MLSMDGQLDLANLAMVLMLTSAVASLWWPGWLSAMTSTAAVIGFNWFFVPPRFTLTVDVQQQALLLLAMLVVNWIISGLVIRQRRLTETARRMADREALLRTWGDTLRDASDPGAHAGALQQALAEATRAPVSLMVLRGLNASPEDATTMQLGETDDAQRAGLALCIRDGRPMGAGTGRYDELDDWYLPLRGGGLALGAALVVGMGRQPDPPVLRPHLQALCDQMGGALHRSWITAQEQQTRELAQLQATRNALLAAISHDFRTPLATIMGAASALHDQGERMDAEQRRRLANAVLDESERLTRLTENTLQLARLDTPGVNLRCDWESVEEIVGAVLRRARRRPEGTRIQAWVEPDLPLLWCDPMLVSQLLDNLLDNGLKYSPDGSAVELHAQRTSEGIALSVSDHGPGISTAWKERVFDVFQRGEAAHPLGDHASRAGVGVGLAVCRAIARAHGGVLSLQPNAAHGCRFVCHLPLGAAAQPRPQTLESPDMPT